MPRTPTKGSVDRNNVVSVMETQALAVLLQVFEDNKPRRR